MPSPTPSSSVVRISIAQMCSTSSIEHNLTTIERLAKRARADSSKILFLPENACFMGVPGTTMALDMAERLDDVEDPPTAATTATTTASTTTASTTTASTTTASTTTVVGRLRAIARQAELWISVGGFQERAPNEKIYNTHIVLDDVGRIVARYRKIHLFDYPAGGLVESRMTAPGEWIEVCETPFAGLNLGLSVCFDLRFPMLYSRLRESKANAMVVPAAFTIPTGQAHWETLLRARAIETQSFVIAAAQTGQHNEKRRSYGHGMVVDPWGRVLVEMGEAEGLVGVDLEMGEVDEVRGRMPMWSPLLLG